MSPNRTALRQLFLGGLLPIAAFTLAERRYGAMGGVMAGLGFGGIEVLWEWWRDRRVQLITWMSNGLVLLFGAASLWENEGSYFKLQPAAMLFLMALMLLASSYFGKAFLAEAALKQNPAYPPEMLAHLRRINTRLGFFCILLGGVGVHSALRWSTEAWAGWKAVGIPAMLFLYLAGEILWIRIRAGRGQGSGNKRA